MTRYRTLRIPDSIYQRLKARRAKVPHAFGDTWSRFFETLLDAHEELEERE